MNDYLINIGNFGLFLGTFLSSTILPFSSEIIVATFIKLDHNPVITIVISTIGNALGSWTCYYLGELGDPSFLKKVLKVKKTDYLKFENKINRFGSYLALCCWLPFIGDLIAIAMGHFKVPLKKFLFFMTIGKFLRYLVIIGLLI